MLMFSYARFGTHLATNSPMDLASALVRVSPGSRLTMTAAEASVVLFERTKDEALERLTMTMQSEILFIRLMVARMFS